MSNERPHPSALQGAVEIAIEDSETAALAYLEKIK